MNDTRPVIHSVNISSGGIPKTPVEVGIVTTQGLQGDRHDHEKHDTPLQAISLLDLEDCHDLKQEGYDVDAGSTGENITCRNLSIDDLAIGDLLHFSGGVVLELTKKRKPCFVLDSIDPTLKDVFGGRCGYLAKVVTTGEIRPGESIEVVTKKQPIIS